MRFLNEKVVLKLIAIGPLIFIPSVVIAIALLIINSHERNFQQNLAQLEANLVDKRKSAVRSKVDSTVDLVAYQKSITRQELMERVRGRVNDAYKLAHTIYDTYAGKRPDAEIRELIVTALRPLVWNGGESFIWILDYSGRFQLAPAYLRHLEGTSIIDFQDAVGRHVIREEIALCKESGEGFLWDTFTKPGEPGERQYEQVAFVRELGHYDWYLGSGEYLDTADRITDAHLLDSIRKIDAIGSHYMFILTKGGSLLLNPSVGDRDGGDLPTSDEPETRKVIGKILEFLKAREGGFVTYEWINPATQERDLKVSYVRNVPETDWVVGSGFYGSEIRNEIDRQKAALYAVYTVEYKQLMMELSLIVLLSLIVSWFISRYVRKSFERYQARISRKSWELERLNETLEEKVIQRTWELEAARAELEKIATTDPLTGVHNRYSLHRIIEGEIQRAMRYGGHFSMIMFDIDHFKRVNDRFGHFVGDEVLRKVTWIVGQILRDVDAMGRYGGEEFLILLPCVSRDNAIVLAERIRRAVETHIFDTVGTVTISLGVAEWEQGERYDALFKRLDLLLYRTKNSGRNRVSG